jgi:hypothetical protein
MDNQHKKHKKEICGSCYIHYYRWTVTQTTTFTQQLNLGIRYFDIRVTARGEEKEDKNVYLRNGPNVLQALKEFKVWIGMHPQEVIIIDFRVVNKMSPLHHKYLLANITQDLFEEKLLPYTGNVKGITLRNMWSLAKQIIVIYPKEVNITHSDLIIISIYPTYFVVKFWCSLSSNVQEGVYFTTTFYEYSAKRRFLDFLEILILVLF